MALLRNLLLLIVITGVSACGADKSPASDQTHIFVSILPLKYFVERIGGDNVNVHVMVGPGQSPETFEPLPKQLSMLSNAQLYFGIDVPFERVWLPKIRAMRADLNVVNLAEHTALSTKEVHRHAQESEQHGHANDPHIWTSPREARLIAAEIEAELRQLLPAESDQIKARYAMLDRELLELDNTIKHVLSEWRGSGEFVVMHPAWGAFAEDYGLEQIAIEDEGKSPSAQALQLLLARLKKESIRWVFIQPQHSQRMAMTVATSIGAEIEVLDPLAENYIDNMKNVAQRLALAMRAQAAAQRGH